MKVKIDVLMATFNGGSYLKEQIESILSQTETIRRLIIRDDCSTDNTEQIVRDYTDKYPDKIFLLENCGEKLGACQNFARLLEAATADYIMFCDQDDVWLPNKVALTLDKMYELEEKFGSATPLMVYTDMKVVDENLELLDESFWRMLRLKPENGNKLNRLVLQNIPSACTMMINKSLRDMASPIPVEAVMHDWWLSLVVAALGCSEYLQEATVLYRQHGKNVCGAMSHGMMKKISWACNRKNRRELLLRRYDIIAKSQKQLELFVKRYNSTLPLKTKKMLLDFLFINDKGFFLRRYYILKHGFFYGSPVDNIGMLLFR